MKNRLTAALLCVSCAASLAACASSGSDTNVSTTANTTASANETAAETDIYSARALVKDNLPEQDYGGRTFKIVTNEYMVNDYVADEANGDIINDAVYARNTAVEERFNIKLENYAADYSTVANYLSSSVLSGDDDCQLVSEHVISLGGVVLKDLFLNWYSIPHIDFTKPWWSDSTTENLTYDGKAILAVGDLSLSSIGRSYCIFFNKRLAEENHIENVYDTVRDGNWTIDYLISLTKDIYSDLNSNGKEDFDDFYGYMSDSFSNLDAYLWAFNNPVFKSENGKQVYCFKTEKTPDIVNKLIDMFKVNKGIYTDNIYVGTGWQGMGLSSDMFAKAHCVFANSTLDCTITKFRDLVDDYGIVPYPKWDSAQDSYYTMVDGGYAAMAVPKSISDPEFVGIITEALCAESYKTLVPAYYDTALKVKLTRDDESVEMIENIVDSRCFDFGYAYDNWKGPSFTLESLIRDGNNNFESYYAENESKYAEHYADVVKLFDSLS